MMLLIHRPCNIFTLNSPSTEPQAALRLWMGITDKREGLGLLLGNSRDLSIAPQDGEAEEQLCPRPQWDKTSLAWNQVLGLDNNCGQGQPQKTHLGSHRLLETMWQCHLPAGAAGTFRIHQLLQKISRDVNGSGEKKKSMQKVTPKISSI